MQRMSDMRFVVRSSFVGRWFFACGILADDSRPVANNSL
jgi:hypothetical protein